MRQGVVGVVDFLVGGGDAHVDKDVRAQHGRANPLQLFAQLGGFLVAAARDGVVVEHAAPVFFRAKAGRAPAEEQQAVGAAGDGGVGHAAHLARLGGVVEVAALPARAGLLLGHHEVARPGAGLVQSQRPG